MAKKALYFTEAERLYVIEQCTLSEIASRLRIAERTVRNWKEEGDWERKRLQYLQSRQSFHEELYEFTRQLMKSIKDDMDAGKEVSTGKMYTFARLLPLISKVKEYEDQTSEGKQDEVDLKTIINEAIKEAIG